MLSTSINNSTTIKTIILNFQDLIKYQKALAAMNGIQLTTWQALKAGISSTTKAMVAWMATNPIGWFTLLAGATVGTALVLKQFNTTLDDAGKTLSEQNEKFKSLSDEVTSLSDELEAATKRIEELEALPSLTIVEDEELQKLKDTTAELEYQLAIKKEEQRIEAEKTAKAANDAYNASYQRMYDGNGELITSPTNENWNPVQELKNTMKAYEVYKKSYDELQAKITQDSEAGEDTSKDQKRLANIKKQMTSIEEHAKEMADVINDQKEAYEGLYAAGFDVQGNDLAIYEEVRGGTEAYREFCNTLNDTTKAYSELSNEEKRQSILSKAVLGGKTKEEAQKIVDSISDEDLEFVGQIHFNRDSTIQSVHDEINTIKSELNKNLNTDETSILSFSDAWEQLKNSTEDATKTLADDLTKLAEAGQLTSEALSKADTSEFFKNAGISAEEATKQINALVSSSTQLQSMSAQISKMSDMLANKKNGTTASASDLSGFDATVKGLESWEEFERVMGSSKSSMEECQAAADALATEWVNNGNFLANLTEENKQFYITQLDNMGVMNAEALVTDRLTTAQLVAENTEKALSAATADLSDKQTSYTQRSVDAVNATYENSAALANQEGMTNVARVALADLVAQQTIFSNQDLGVSDKIAALGELAGAYMGAAAQASFLNKTQGGLNSNYRISPEEAWAQVKDEFSRLDTTIVTPVIKPTGSSTYKTKSGGKDSKTTIDWIQRKLDVLQKKIDQTKAKFENLFTLKDKKNNLNEQIKLTQKLLATTEKSAERYKKAASNVGLSDALKKKVQNGAYDITEYDSKTSEKIQKYQDYIDKYNDLIKQSEELNTTIRDYEKQIFDEIKTTFDNQIGHIDDKIDDLNNQISAVENKGLIADASYYNAQASVHEQILGKLESEKKKLREQLKEIDKQTPAWYSAVAAIQDVDNQIADATNKISEMKKAINDVADTLSGNILDSFHDLNEEADTLITLLGDNLTDDKLGNLTKEGIAALGLYNQQMNVSKASAENIQNEIKSIQNAINNGTYTKFIDSNGMERQFESIYQAKDRIKELQADYRSEIQSTYQYESKIVDLMKQKYQSELNYVKELIDKKKEQLAAEQDLYQYSRDIKTQVDGINSIKKQLSALQGDTSIENKSRVQKLEKQLKTQEDDLRDKEYNRFISDSQNMLDNLYSEYQQLIESVSKDRDTLLKEGNQLIASNGAQIQQTINETASEYGYQMSETMTSATSQITSGLSGIKGVLDNIETYLKDRVVDTNGNGAGGGNIEDYTPAGQIKSVLENGSNKNPTSSLAKAVSEAFGVGLNRHEMAQISGLLGLKYKYEDFLDGSPKKTEAKNAVLQALIKEGYLKKSGGSYIRGFANGGVISSVADAIRMNGDKVLISGEPGERMLTDRQNGYWEKWTEAIPNLINFAETIKPNVNVPNAIDRNIGGVTYGGNNQINIEFPNVTNYEDFMRKFQSDPKAEQLVQRMTASALTNNGSRLGKYNIKF